MEQTGNTVSRRAALKTVAGTALTAGLGSLSLAGANSAAAAGGFTDIRQFQGTWNGSYDGRSSRLTIRVQGQPPSDRYTLFFTFTDESGASYSGTLQNIAASTYHLPYFKLGANGELDWQGLLLHTWNTDYISGFSVWNSGVYPMSWTRSTVNDPFTPGPQWTGYTDYFGDYAGFLDGRNARLVVSRGQRPDPSQAGSPLKPTVERVISDTDRGTSWFAWNWEADVQRQPVSQQRILLEGFYTTPDPQPTTLKLDYIFPHGWNRNYISGRIQQIGSPSSYYGIQFKRV
ncbi:hypothetical protein IAG44_00965 [Streptomyces roseirectus]|uniref:Uncharacterized protein n=1 Tax=Streptomyces roseirectus TaxID=2768066 RepID=A0A7H0I5W0_9ACTN|nr:hypothetical protein [Streptomyces roseirectus]QNP68176.1 hypothetical protein IAG44_00965 [Streptomyces roseirectus]